MVEQNKVEEQVAPAPHAEHRIKSFVVRAGRMTEGQIRAIEELGPKYMVDVEDLKPLNIDEIFGRTGAPLVVEIGFGMGVSFVQMAKDAPECNFLGIEVHPPGVGSALKLIEENQLTNVKVIKYDAFEVLSKCLQPESVDILQIFFPDPWPKKRQRKRRLSYPDRLKEYYRRLKKGGKIYFRTDNTDLFNDSVEYFKSVNLYQIEVIEPFLSETQTILSPTEYENKFRAKGVRIHLLIATK